MLRSVIDGFIAVSANTPNRKQACVKSHNPISKIAAAQSGGIRCYRMPEVLLPGIIAVAWNLLIYALFSRRR
jgi:hypothetical protein